MGGSGDERMWEEAEQYDAQIDQTYVTSLTLLGEKICKMCSHSAWADETS